MSEEEKTYDIPVDEDTMAKILATISTLDYGEKEAVIRQRFSDIDSKWDEYLLEEHTSDTTCKRCIIEAHREKARILGDLLMWVTLNIITANNATEQTFKKGKP